MNSRKGFTLVELMVVVLIVGILAAVAIPVMQGRIEQAKWSEGKAAMGSIATAIRAYCAEKGRNYSFGGETLSDLGFLTGDLDGNYFSVDCYDFTISAYNDFTITCDASASTKSEAPTGTMTLDDDGAWTGP